MASAVLASRNEPYWGEHKVYMRKYTNNSTNKNPNLSRFNPSPNPNSFLNWKPSPGAHHSRHIQDSSGRANVWHSDEPSPRSAPLATYIDTSINREGPNLDDHHESSPRRYVTFRFGSFSRRELKELKKRLILELNQVRSLRNRIEAPELESRHGHHVSHFSGGYERGEVIRPPSFQLDHALESPVPPVSIKGIGTPKAKKSSGQKRAMPFSSGRDPKRPAVAESYMGKLLTSMMRRCGQILAKLMKHRHGWVFNKPVDVVALGLHDYHTIIRHPMDLGTVKFKLGKNEYRSPIDFSSDVKLTFQNALIYNSVGSDVYIMAETLLSLFEEMFNPANQKFEAEQRKAVSTDVVNEHIRVLPPSVVPVEVKKALHDTVPVAKKFNSTHPQSTLSNPPPVQEQAPASPIRVPATTTTKPVRSSAKMGKPKARDLNKRDMSLDEKEKLATNLQNLPPGPDGMDQIMRIIKKRITSLAPHEDEIELDIEALDNETLWELDRFVDRFHKKAADKMKREGVTNLDSAVQINNQSPVSELPPEPKGKKGDAGEEDVDIGEDIPITNFPPVEIEKDAANGSSKSSSSSSSSSGSDSSSSDSDSGSSSVSDSDVDSIQSPYVEPQPQEGQAVI